MSDTDTTAFVARFIADVDELAGSHTRSNVAALLAHAIACGGDAWRPLYRVIANIVTTREMDNNRAAHARLQAFVDENSDLAERGLAYA